jgi:CRP-like cAMP-binding protein
MINIGRTTVNKQRRDRILLFAGHNSKAASMRDDDIAEDVGYGRITVERIRKRFIEEGLQRVLARHKLRRQYYRKLDGRGEARLIAIGL